MDDVQLGPTAQQVLTFMRSQPKEVFTPNALAEHLDCTAMQIEAALDTLCEHNLIEKARTVSGRDEYRLRS